MDPAASITPMKTKPRALYVYDPLYGQVEIEARFEPIVNSLYFRRLQHLRQLGLCYLSLPGGNHTRYEHSLGAFHLSSFVARMVQASSAVKKHDKETLMCLLRLGTLCHDIGHGPFSHMTENVLTGLGASFCHEEVGAAIVTHRLIEEFRPFAELGITPSLIGQLMTKTAEGPLAQCAEELVSSDLDLDRLDYLHRDSHYSAEHTALFRPELDFEGVWRLQSFGQSLRFELTQRGIEYAEKILFLRRNNYRRIVYETRHMCLTAMFEKAVHAASEHRIGLFGEYCRALIPLQLDWTNESSVAEHFPTIWRLYGLADYQALELLEATPLDTVRQLIRRIRNGDCFHLGGRHSWTQLHYVAKQRILGLKTDAAALRFRRCIETELGDRFEVDSAMIACHLPRFKPPKPLSIGTEQGDLLEGATALGRFLVDDVQHQYAIELFIDRGINETDRRKIEKEFEEMMRFGKIDF
jgi:hypothetical protein